MALLAGGQRIDGYLNATPRQGTETLANWSRFRPEHNQDEGDRGVRFLAATTTARFRSGRGACSRASAGTREAQRGRQIRTRRFRPDA